MRTRVVAAVMGLALMLVACVPASLATRHYRWSSVEGKRCFSTCKSHAYQCLAYCPGGDGPCRANCLSAEDACCDACPDLERVPAP